MCACGQDEGSNTDAEWQNDVPETFTGLVGVPSVQEGREDGQNVRWCGQQKGVNVVVAECLDNSLFNVSSNPSQTWGTCSYREKVGDRS